MGLNKTIFFSFLFYLIFFLFPFLRLLLFLILLMDKRFWGWLVFTIGLVAACAGLGTLCVYLGNELLYERVPSYECVCQSTLYNCTPTWQWASNCTFNTTLTVTSCDGATTTSTSCHYTTGIIWMVTGVYFLMTPFIALVVALCLTRWRYQQGYISV